MKRLMVLGFALLAVLVLPVVASATHLTDFDGTADCDGWCATYTISWHSQVFEAELEYAVVLMNDEGDVLNEIVVSETITREPGSEAVQFYEICAPWEGNFVASYFTVLMAFELTAPSGTGGADQVSSFGAEIMLECTVDADDTNWGSLKSLYR